MAGVQHMEGTEAAVGRTAHRSHTEVRAQAVAVGESGVGDELHVMAVLVVQLLLHGSPECPEQTALADAE